MPDFSSELLHHAQNVEQFSRAYEATANLATASAGEHFHDALDQTYDDDLLLGDRLRARGEVLEGSIRLVDEEVSQLMCEAAEVFLQLPDVDLKAKNLLARASESEDILAGHRMITTSDLAPPLRKGVLQCFDFDLFDLAHNRLTPLYTSEALIGHVTDEVQKAARAAYISRLLDEALENPEPELWNKLEKLCVVGSSRTHRLGRQVFRAALDYPAFLFISQEPDVAERVMILEGASKAERQNISDVFHLPAAILPPSEGLKPGEEGYAASVTDAATWQMLHAEISSARASNS